MIENPPTSDEWKALQRLRDAQEPRYPRPDPPPPGAITASMLESMMEKGETPEQFFERRRDALRALLSISPVLLPATNKTSTRLD